MAKNTRWRRHRHKVVRDILAAVLRPYSRLVYGITVEQFTQQGDRPYLILCNHQTAFDQFFMGLAFKGPVYYIASEDLFSKGFISSLIRFLVAPIPIKKQTTDITAIKNCIKVAKEGGTIGMSPEGNRTFSGKTEHMSPAVASLAKKLGFPIAFFRIEGGFGVHPRWSDVIRRGKMRAYVSKVLEPEEYGAMTNDQLFAVIEKELYVNEACVDGEYRHKKAAEYVERVLYVCPDCGLSSFESHGDRFACTTCGKQVIYLPTKELKGVDFDLPFRFLNDWYEYQKDFVNRLDVREYTEMPLFEDRAALSQVIISKSKKRLRKDASVRLYGDRIAIDEGGEEPMVFPFTDLYAVTVLGKNKVNLYHGSTVYQLKGSKRFNGIKYVNIYHRAKNIKDGSENGKFLGL